jgi:hypothetical protein
MYEVWHVTISCSATSQVLLLLEDRACCYASYLMDEIRSLTDMTIMHFFVLLSDYLRRFDW